MTTTTTTRNMTPTELAVFRLLSSRTFVSQEQMFQHLWGACPDGGPLDPGKTMAVYIYNLRRILGPAGIAIETKRGVGWRIPARCKELAVTFLLGDAERGWSVGTRSRASSDCQVAA